MTMVKTRTCAICGARGRVVDSRAAGPVTRRRVECRQGHRWTTVELRAETKGERVHLRRFKAMVAA